MPLSVTNNAFSCVLCIYSVNKKVSTFPQSGIMAKQHQFGNSVLLGQKDRDGEPGTEVVVGTRRKVPEKGQPRRKVSTNLCAAFIQSIYQFPQMST